MHFYEFAEYSINTAYTHKYTNAYENFSFIAPTFIGIINRNRNLRNKLFLNERLSETSFA